MSPQLVRRGEAETPAPGNAQGDPTEGASKSEKTSMTAFTRAETNLAEGPLCTRSPVTLSQAHGRQELKST